MPVLRTLYSALLYVLAPLVLLRLLWRSRRNPGYLERISERFGFAPPLGGDRVIWVHAVSVGEVRACAPLVHALRNGYPEYRIVVTTMTPTGYDQVRQLFDPEIEHRYVPYDLPSAVHRFLDRSRPALALIMETELWPNIFHQCHERDIPIVLTNVRMSEASMRRYLKVKALIRSTLRQVTAIAAQSQADAERMKALGADPSSTTVTGSIKFEINLPASLTEAAEVLRLQWGADRPTWLAASTHEGEDELILAAHAALRHQPRFTRALLVLVPRHPERFAPVARLARKHGFPTAIRSETRDAVLSPDTEVLVGDTMGELQLFYAAVDAAFVGGSLVPTGGHNLLEAAAAGKPAVFGPYMFNFNEIAQMALERGAGVQVRDTETLVTAIADFLGNANRRFAAGEAGRRLVEENRGALERNMRLLEGIIGPRQA